MIATISGNITQVDTGSLVVEVGGVGLLVYVPDPISDQANVGETILLHTYLVEPD